MATPVFDNIPLTSPSDPRIDGLVQGSSWTFDGGPHVLEYSFHHLVSFEPEVWGEVASLATITAGMAAALNEWAKVANLTFVEVTGQPLDGDLTTADLSIALTGFQLGIDGVAGFAYYPDPYFVDHILFDP